MCTTRENTTTQCVGVTFTCPGAVVEAFKEPGGRGNVARILLSSGTLHQGQHFVCGSSYGRVRGIRNEHMEALSTVEPGIAFDLWGCNELPNVGDDFFVAVNTRRPHLVSLALHLFFPFFFFLCAYGYSPAVRYRLFIVFCFTSFASSLRRQAVRLR